MKTFLLFLLLPLAGFGQSLKPIPVLNGKDTTGFRFTLEQTNRLIEITEKGFLSSDSLQVEKSVTTAQDKELKNMDNRLLNSKSLSDNLSEQLAIEIKDNKKQKKQTWWIKIKGKVLGFVASIEGIIIILMVLIAA